MTPSSSPAEPRPGRRPVTSPPRPLVRGCLLLAPAFAGLSLAWIGLVHAIYLATLDHGLFLDANGAPTPVWFLPNLVVPLGLLLGLWQLTSWVRSLAFYGAASGVAVGLWLNAVLLTVPILGLYPNLPTLPLGVAFSEGRGVDAGPPFFLPMLAANPLLWGVVGWLAFPQMFVARR